MENKCCSLDDLPVTLRVEELMPILGIGRNTAVQAQLIQVLMIEHMLNLV